MTKFPPAMLPRFNTGLVIASSKMKRGYLMEIVDLDTKAQAKKNLVAAIERVAQRLVGAKKKVRLSGIVLIRQRPGAGNVTFITLEDETGIANVIVWQRLYENYRRTVLSAAMIDASIGPSSRTTPTPTMLMTSRSAP